MKFCFRSNSCNGIYTTTDGARVLKVRVQNVATCANSYIQHKVKLLRNVNHAGALLKLKQTRNLILSCIRVRDTH